MKTIFKSTLCSLNNRRNILFIMVLISSILAITLTGCSEGTDRQVSDDDPVLDFSINLDTHEEQIRVNLITSNQSDVEFPGDNDFEGKMSLWNQSSELVGWVEVEILPFIGIGESDKSVTLSWDADHLDPGINFLTWSGPNYGGTVTIFYVAKILSGASEVVSSHSFQTEPAAFSTQYQNSGNINTFTLTEDGSVFIAGESPLPDGSCLFPVLYSQEGLVQGFPFGECVQIADGQWHLDVPADPGNERIHLEDETSYRVIIFSEDLQIAPSEPFQVMISPPVSE